MPHCLAPKRLPGPSPSFGPSPAPQALLPRPGLGTGCTLVSPPSRLARAGGHPAGGTRSPLSQDLKGARSGVQRAFPPPGTQMPVLGGVASWGVNTSVSVRLLDPAFRNREEGDTAVPREGRREQGGEGEPPSAVAPSAGTRPWCLTVGLCPAPLAWRTRGT